MSDESARRAASLRQALELALEQATPLHRKIRGTYARLAEHTSVDNELELARGQDPRFDAHLVRVKEALTSSSDPEVSARRLVETLALALQGSLLVRVAPAEVAEAFCASRLGRDSGFEYGTLPAGTNFDAIIARSLPRA